MSFYLFVIDVVYSDGSHRNMIFEKGENQDPCLLLGSPAFESRYLPHRHLADDIVRILRTQGSIDDHLHLSESTIGTDKCSLLIAEGAVLGRERSIFLASTTFRIFGEWHATGLTLMLAGLLEGGEHIHRKNIRNREW